MAVDKSFVVKNGLEVNSDLIVADASSKKVGIASTGPRSTLDVRGGIAATDINITGIATIANLQVADGDVDLTNLKVTGFSTLGGLSVDQLTVTGFTTFTDLSYDEISGRNLILTGIATIPQLDGITAFTDLNGTNATVGVATITTANVTTANVTTLAGYPNFSGGATVVGTVTAAHFSGGGLGVGIKTTGSVVGYGFTMLNFVGSGNTFAVNGTTVDISIAGGGGGGSASIGVGSTPGDAFTGIVTAGNLWYNTGLGRLFIYYQDDNSAQWVDAAPFNVGIITQLTSVGFNTGTVSSPALSFGNDSNSGFFAPADGSVAYSSNAAGIVTFNSTGVVAKSYFGDGSNLTGIDATALKDSAGGSVKVQANPGGIVITGVATATTFVGNLTGNVTGNVTGNTSGTAGGLTGTPDITVANITAGIATFSGAISATTGTFTGDVDIADKIVHTGDTNTAIRFPAADTFTVETSGSERVRVDPNGKFLIGTTETSSNQSGALNVFGTDGTTSFVSIRRGSNNVSGPRLALCKSRNTTDGSNTIVQDDDILGTIHFYGNDGAGFEEGAAIAAVVDGTPGSDDLPTSLTFSTTPDGSNTKAERLRITSAGDFGYGTDSPGCFFEISKDDSGATVQQKLLNRSTDANSSSNNFIYVNGAAAGDPFTTWTVGGVTSWSMGIDNSDSDKLVINNGSNLNSNLISVDINGNVTVNETITADGYEGNLELDVFLFG